MAQQIGLRYGLLAGFGSTFYMACLYSISKELYYNQWYGIGVTVLYIFMMLKAGLKYRRTVNPDATFQNTIRVTFITVIVASLVVAIFSYLMPNVVDTSLLELLKGYQLEDLVSQKAQQNDMDNIKRINTNIAFIETNGVQFTFSDAAFSFARSLISGFIFAALSAYLTKKH
jgi:hypothetical protein